MQGTWLHIEPHGRADAVVEMDYPYLLIYQAGMPDWLLQAIRCKRAIVRANSSSNHSIGGGAEE